MNIKNKGDEYLRDYEKLRAKELKFFKNLLLNPNFIKSVKEFRKKYKIPSTGFKTTEDHQKLLFQYKTELKEGIMIQEKVELDGTDKPKSTKTEVKTRFNEYYLDLCDILKSCSLSLEWVAYINHYICFNKPPKKMNEHSVFLRRKTFNGVVVEEEIVFTIGATMSLKRHFTKKFMGQTIWENAIEPLQKLMQGYNEKTARPHRSRTNIQAKVQNLTDLGYDDKEIYEQFSELEIKNIGSIRQHRKRFKEKIKIKG